MMTDATNAPGNYPKRILLCVTGLSPQIITETVFALAVNHRGLAQFVPTEIWVVTTTEGKRRVQQSLFGGGSGQFDRLCTDYGLNRATICFNTETIRVICDSDGRELDDIQDTTGNTAAADAIIACVRELTRDDNSALHISIAGGRKTMGFLMGYAATLFARPQDRLSHVLVNPPFESHQDFYYPPPQPRTLEIRGPSPRIVSTADAQVILAEIPFVRLRDGLDESLLNGQASYSEVVRRAQSQFDEPSLLINADNRAVSAHGRALKLAPVHFLWLYWMARRIERGLPPCAFDEMAADDLIRAACELEGRGRNKMADAIRKHKLALQNDNDRNYFEQTRSKLNTSLLKQLGRGLADIYAIRVTGKRTHTRYGLKLHPRQIHIERPEE